MLAIYGFHYIIKLSVAYSTTTGPIVTLSLFYKKHRIPLLLLSLFIKNIASHTSTFQKEKTKFQLYYVHWLTAIWACKIVKLIKFYCYSGFHVANSIYSMLKNSPGVFNPLEVQISNIVKRQGTHYKESIKPPEKWNNFSEPGNVHRRPVP